MRTIKNLKVVLLTVLSVLAVSCMEKDLHDPDELKPGKEEPAKEANTFDFSTIQNIKLTVDYSSFKTYGPVFFSVYGENPFVGEGEEERLDESITPIYEDYTNAKGKFSMNIQLPAYAKHLYVVTGNFFVSERLMEVDVQNGVAEAVASKMTSGRTRAAITRSGAQTSDLSNMQFLSYNIDEAGNTIGAPIYKNWVTPLGTWDSESGRPSYLIDPTTLPADKQKLICTEEEIEGLFSAIGQALDANKPCNMEYRNHADLTLEKESEVTITMLGGNTCWNSTLGYYYYMEDEQPTNTTDLNVIMLFPNTQDGQWSKLKSNQSFNNNIGIQRGDAVQLMYYPNIASGDLTGATTVFPKGIKIGFILKANGWAMQGDSYGITGYKDSKRKYNVWGTSTNGISYCNPAPFGTAGVNPYQIPNEEGLSRSAKFAYNAPNGDKYAVIAFEDACNDEDYDDVIFALKPVNAFTPLPEIENNKTTTVGVYAFEDLWPSKGDYDLNDVVVDFKHVKEMSKLKTEKEFKIYKESFYLTTYQNYVTLTSGLALKLNTPAVPTSIDMKKIASGSEEVVDVEYNVIDDVYYLTEDVTGELGSTYILELTYSVGHYNDKSASVQPFIFRHEEGGDWEVHIPFEAPTARMNFSYFGKQDDASVPAENKFFVRSGDYPFAFFLMNAKISNFKNTILKRQYESKKINDLYPGFLPWSVSKGATNTDWYLHPVL